MDFIIKDKRLYHKATEHSKAKLVDLKNDAIPFISVAVFKNGYSPAFCQKFALISDYARAGSAVDRCRLLYFDMESGETLPVWDSIHGYAWEV